jgi:tetratricopeptide (TPR) repeat protein
MPVFPCVARPAATAILLAALLASHSTQAQPRDPLLDQATLLMQQRQPQQAYDLLAPEESRRANDAAFDYLLGIAALDAGHITRAIFALERAVELQPDNNLARAELARALLAAGEPAGARQELVLARRGNMPAEAAAAIDRVLGSLEQEPLKGEPKNGPWRAYVEAFAGHDSNVNSATAAGQFALPAFGGIIFNLDAANQRRSDSFGGLAAGAGLQLPLATGWELNASANARSLHNRRAHDVDNRQLDGSLGLAYTTGASVFSAAAQANSYDIDSHRYRRASGLSGQWQHSLNAVSQLSVFTQWSRLAYAADASRDADRGVLGLGYARAFNDGDQVAYASVYRAREKTRSDGVDNYGHHATGARLGAEARVGSAATAFAALQFETRRYGGSEPFFDTTRRDHQLDVTAGMHFVPAPQWRITPQVSHVRAASNVVLYDYRRTVWQLSVRREFN